MTFSALPVRFDEARRRAFAAARGVAGQGYPVVLVRDVLGRFSLVVDDTGKEREARQGLESWESDFTDRLGRYHCDEPVLLASDMFAADALLNSPRAVPDAAGPPAAGSVRFLDNTVVGEDWAKVVASGSGGIRTHRTALYGFKGGVGRTTATALLARYLADRGHVVLVVDLDLESPGAGPLLMGRSLPPHGLVDQLVEDAVGNAEGLEIVARSSYTPRRADDGRFGELWVAPARGGGSGGGAESALYSYVDKLNRVYADTSGATFADRLERAVRACEEAVERESDEGRRPDVVLLDSRAGIHDVAAVAISRLCDLALLFGADNAQTWTGYGDLFAAWQSSGKAADIREKLRMVASTVPDSVHYPMATYLESFRQRAFECFEALYDDVAPSGPPGDGAVVETADGEPFALARQDDQAPHWAIPILFEPGLVGMDAANAPAWQDRAFVKAAYGEFLVSATRLIEDALDAGGHQEGTG